MKIQPLVSSLLFLVVAVLPTGAGAATYVVAPGGDDQADGSAGSPWLTLQHAADTVTPGDEVRVQAGSYAGFILGTSGTDTQRITFVADPGVIIDADSEAQGSGIHLENVSFVTLEGFTISGVTGRGIAHRGATATSPVEGLEIRGITILDVGREGMYLSQVSHSLIEGNTITGAGTSGADRTHGIYLSNGGSDFTTLRANVISGSGTAGIHFNGDLSIGGDGIINDIVVEQNHIFDNGQNGLNMDGVQSALIQNNLIHGNASNGLRAYAIDGAEGPANLHIVNNTFVVPAGAGWCVRITDDLGGLVLFNNILMNEGSNGSIALNQVSGLTSASNAVVDVFTPDRDATYLDLAGWQALGFDVGSFIATPAELFVEPSGGNLRLRPGAPALDVGLALFKDVSAPAIDQEGTPRPGGAGFDLGAFELCDGACGSPDGGSDGGSPDGAVGDDGGVDAGSSDAGGEGEDPKGCGCDTRTATRLETVSLLFLAGLIGVAGRRRPGR